MVNLKKLSGNLYRLAQIKRNEKAEGPNTKHPSVPPGDELTVTLWTLASFSQSKLNP